MRPLAAISFVVAACGHDEPAESEAESEAEAEVEGWALVFDELPGSVLSCFAAGEDDVWLVGTGGLLLHWDGATFRRTDTKVDGWLWWTWGCSSDDMWAVGEDGVMLRVQGGAVAPVASGANATLFGVWGASCDDVWAVGGSPTGGGENDVMLHWDGASVARVAPPEEFGVSLFKVWGSAADDVIVVGAAGLIWRGGAAGWAREESTCAQRLFTVYGSAPGDVLAVGGQCATRWNGEAWSAIPGLDITGQLPNGVHVEPDGRALIVGFGALKARRTADGTWVNESALDPYGVDFHAACGDGSGGFFAVGGNFLTPGSEQHGVVAHYGARHPQAAFE
ncbi:MAG: hypothetical protein AABZ30_15740 [Myxococcota bacterium]